MLLVLIPQMFFQLARFQLYRDHLPLHRGLSPHRSFLSK